MSGMTDPGNRSSAEIEREVESTRAGLTDTLGELRDRASPGQLFEQALDYARSSGGAEMARNLGASVRDNPLPLLLIGAGIGWMMLSGGQRGAGATWQGSPTPHGGPAGGRGHGLRDTAAAASGRVAEGADAAWQGAADAASSLRDAAGQAGERVADLGEAARRRAGDLGGTAERGLGWVMREQPLVLGAIGVALGAAVGALLPSTEAEDRLMGETRDRALEQAKDVAQQGYERVKETASTQLGGSASGAGEEARGVAARAGEVIRDAARDLAGEAREAISGAGTGGNPGGGERPRGDDAQPQRPPVPDPRRTGPL